MNLSLRRAEEGDLPALAGLPGAPSMDELRQQLFDAARSGGANTVIALRAGEVVGCAGWVEAVPWLYGAPLVALDEAVARRLIAHVVERASAIGAERLRIGATAVETGKRAALVAEGFEPALDFIWFARALQPGGRALP